LLADFTEVEIDDETRGLLQLHAAAVDDGFRLEKVVADYGGYAVGLVEVLVLVAAALQVLGDHDAHRVHLALVFGQVAEHALHDAVVPEALLVLEPLETLDLLVDQVPGVAEVMREKQVHAHRGLVQGVLLEVVFGRERTGEDELLVRVHLEVVDASVLEDGLDGKPAVGAEEVEVREPLEHQVGLLVRSHHLLDADVRVLGDLGLGLGLEDVVHRQEGASVVCTALDLVVVVDHQHDFVVLPALRDLQHALVVLEEVPDVHVPVEHLTLGRLVRVLLHLRRSRWHSRTIAIALATRLKDC